jgi:hypothetical protein
MPEYEQSAKGPVVTPARVVAAICVIVPFVAVLYVPIYDKDKPELGGFPFFFWWQLVWVGVTAALMGLAYYVVRREEVGRRATAAVGNVAAAAPADAAPAAAEPQNTQDTESAQEAEADGTAEEGDAE